jgi:hypothetical protein
MDTRQQIYQINESIEAYKLRSGITTDIPYSKYPPDFNNWRTLLYTLVKGEHLDPELALEIEKKMETEIVYQNGGFTGKPVATP